MSNYDGGGRGRGRGVGWRSSGNDDFKRQRQFPAGNGDRNNHPWNDRRKPEQFQGRGGRNQWNDRGNPANGHFQGERPPWNGRSAGRTPFSPPEPPHYSQPNRHAQGNSSLGRDSDRAYPPGRGDERAYGHSHYGGGGGRGYGNERSHSGRHSSRYGPNSELNNQGLVDTVATRTDVGPDGSTSAEPDEMSTVQPAKQPPAKPWSEMSMPEKFQDQLPYDDLANMPALEYPPDFEARQHNAVDMTEKWLRAHSSQKAQTAAKVDSYSDDDSTSTTDSPFRNIVVTSDHDPVGDKVAFLKALPNCVVLNAGFHAVVLFAGMDEWCYCPCSKKMESWRKRFGVPGFDEVWSTNATTHACCSTNKFSPHGLLCHLRTKAEGGQFIHEMIDQYLRYLYTDYLDDGSKKRNHKALYDVNSSNYKMAEAMENRKIRRLIGILQVELDMQKTRAIELEQKAQRMKNIEVTNADLYKQLKEKEETEKKLREKLNIGPASPKVALTSERLTMYRKQIDYIFKLWRTLLIGEKHAAAEKLAADDLTPVPSFTIKVVSKFDLQDVFEMWSVGGRHTNQALFDSLDDENIYSWLVAWNVEFSSRSTLSRKTQEHLKMIAVDEGGPTRAFLSQLFQQMGSLYISISEEKKMSLFEASELLGQCVPQCDDTLKSCFGSNVDLEAKARSYYRAVGRAILYCLRTNNTIASHAVPGLYRNYLLRGVSPLSEEYKIDDLVQDVMPLTSGIPLDQFMEIFVMYSETEEDGETDTKVIFRKAVHSRWIGDRSIALEALREGITLKDRIDFSFAFGPIPLEAVSRIFFSKEGVVTVEDVIAALKPSYDESVGLEQQRQIIQMEVDSDGAEICKGLLPDFLRAQGSLDEDFPRRFTYWCTGQMYVPKRESGGEPFKITVEFNDLESPSPDSLPVVHTCTKDLKFPALGYDGNREVLEQKIIQSMDQTKDMFTVE